MVKRTIGVILLCLILSACSNQDDSNLQRVSFNVDSTLLSNKTHQIESLNIAFNQPAGWKYVSPENMVGENQNLLQNASPVVSIFSNPIDSSALIINNFNQVHDSTWGDVTENPGKYFNNDGRWMNIQKSEFIHNSIKIDQIFFQNRKFVNMKLLGETPNKKRFALDFFLSRGALESQKRSMESTIGSLHPVEHNN